MPNSEKKELLNRPLAGSLQMLGSAIAFAGVGALAKFAMATLETEMVVFFRNFMALVIMMPWLLVRHRHSIVKTRRPGLHLVRAAAGLGAMYCIFYALHHLQLGEAVLLSFTAPVFIPLVAYWWLKESVSIQTGLAIAIGFVGVALILKPGTGVIRFAAFVGLMAGVLMAIGQVGIRRLSATEPAMRIVFYFTLISTVVSAIPLLWTWQAAPVNIWLALVGMGVLAVIGQVMMTNGYRLAPAARIGPISYVNVLFSTLLGWLFWNETLDPMTWVGAVLICLAGIVTSYQRDTIVASPGTVHTIREHFAKVPDHQDLVEEVAMTTDIREAFHLSPLSELDPLVSQITGAEAERIESTINLIAAENYPPIAVNQAQGSVFTIKAAEGYPGGRYHAGCSQADRLEDLAVERARQLFGAEHANVQPHSGTSANLAVYFSVLEVGDRVLSMKLSHGGHLSHGDAASVTSRCFKFQHYGLNGRTELIDYDRLREQAISFRPKMIVAGASSYPRLIDYECLADIANEISAYLLVDMAHIAGLVAAKAIPSPVPFSDFVTFTTYKTLQGGRGGVILSKGRHAGKLEKAIFPGAQGTPSLNMVAAKAVCFLYAMRPEFSTYQDQVLANASEIAENFARLGYRIVSGGTDNHLVLVDLQRKNVSGCRVERVLESIGIVVNRNVIPNDPLPADVTSGIRIGSPAITTRGMGKGEVRLIVELIDKAIVNCGQENILNQIRDQVMELCRLFPVYSNDRKHTP